MATVRTSLSYTFYNLPPGKICTLVDDLQQDKINNVMRARPVQTGIVGTSGSITFTNLTDSTYSLLFTDYDCIQYSIYHVQIGNPDLIQTVNNYYITNPIVNPQPEPVEFSLFGEPHISVDGKDPAAASIIYTEDTGYPVAMVRFTYFKRPDHKIFYCQFQAYAKPKNVNSAIWFYVGGEYELAYIVGEENDPTITWTDYTIRLEPRSAFCPDNEPAEIRIDLHAYDSSSEVGMRSPYIYTTTS